MVSGADGPTRLEKLPPKTSTKKVRSFTLFARGPLHERRPLDDLPVVRRILFDDFAVLEVAFFDHLL